MTVVEWPDGRRVALGDWREMYRVIERSPGRFSESVAYAAWCERADAWALSKAEGRVA